MLLPPIGGVPVGEPGVIRALEGSHVLLRNGGRGLDGTSGLLGWPFAMRGG